MSDPLITCVIHDIDCDLCGQSALCLCLSYENNVDGAICFRCARFIRRMESELFDSDKEAEDD